MTGSGTPILLAVCWSAQTHISTIFSGTYTAKTILKPTFGINLLSYVEQEFDRILHDHVDGVMEDHKRLIEASGKKYNPALDIAAIQEKHHFLRYDYISESFRFYTGREKCYQQEKRDQAIFTSLMEQFYDHMYYEFVTPVTEISVTGGYELNRTWFPYSKLYHSSDTGISPLEKTTNELVSFLLEKEYFGVPLNTIKQAEVMEHIHLLIQKYGQKDLGFGRKIPGTLKLTLKHFGLEVAATSKHKQSDQIIRKPHTIEQG